MNLSPAIRAFGLTLLFLAFSEIKERVYAQSPLPSPAVSAAQLDQYGDPLPEKAVMRLGSLRFRHEFGVNALLFSPNGKMIAAQYGEGTFLQNSPKSIVLWDAATGRTCQRLSVAMADNAWRIGFQTDYYRRAFDFSPDGKRLAVVEKRGSIGLWEAATGIFLRRLPLSGKQFEGAILRFSPDGNSLIAVVEERKICRIDLATGKVHWQREVLSKGAVFDFTFSPDGKRLAILSQNAFSFELMDAVNGKIIRSIKRKNDKWTTSATFTPDGKSIAVAQYDRIVLCNAATGEEEGELRDDEMRRIFGLAYLPDGRKLASCSRDGAVRIWDVGTRKVHTAFRAGRNPFPQAALSMALSPDGKTVALGTDGGRVIHLWDVATGTKKSSGRRGHGAAIGKLNLSPDGKALISNDADEKVHVWDLTTGKLLRQLPCGYGSYSVSSDRQRLAMTHIPINPLADEQPEPVLWDLEKSSPIAQLKLEERWQEPFPEIEMNSAQFVAGGKLLVTAGHIRFDHDPKQEMGLVLVWDGRTGRRLQKIALPGIAPVSTVVSLPDGKTLILGTENSIVLFDLDRGKVLSTLSKIDQLRITLQLSSSGRFLWATDGENKLRCWELFSCQAIRLPESLSRAAGFFFALSPDGRMLAAEGSMIPKGFLFEGASRDSLIRLWNMENGEEVGQLRGHESPASTGLFSRDGSKLITGLENGSILVWDISTFTRRVHETKRLSPAELQTCWNDLAATDASRAYRAITRLVAASNQGIALLRERLPLEPPVEAALIHRLMGDLDSGSFAVRQKASQELEKRIEITEPFLMAELGKKPSLEVRRRIEQILSSAAKPISSPRQLRAIRAVEVLERIGSLEAKHLLVTLAKGAMGLRITQEAKTSSERLSQPRP